MATVANLVVNLRANTAQFGHNMSAASKDVRAFERTVAAVNSQLNNRVAQWANQHIKALAASYRAGAISLQEFNAGADQLRGFVDQGTKAINNMHGGTLALRVILRQVSPELSAMASGFHGLGAVGAVAAVGLATIGTVIRHVARDVDAFRESMQRVIDTGEDFAEALNRGKRPQTDFGTGLEAQRTALRKQREALEAEVASRKRWLPLSRAWGGDTMVAGMEQAIENLRRQETHLAEMIAGEKRTAAMDEANKKAKEYADAMKKYADEVAAAARKQRDALDKALGGAADKLWRQITVASGAATSEGWQLFDLRALGATTQQLDHILNLMRQLDTIQKGQKVRNDFLNEAKRIYEQTRTPLEQYKQGIKDVSRLWELGFIDQDTLRRREAQLLEDYKRTTGGGEAFKGGGLRDIRAAFVDIAGLSMGGDNIGNKLDAQLAEARKQTEFQRRIADMGALN